MRLTALVALACAACATPRPSPLRDGEREPSFYDSEDRERLSPQWTSTPPRQVPPGCVARSLQVSPEMLGGTEDLVLRFFVNEDGSPAAIQTVRPVPEALLAELKRAVMSCRFEPARDPDGRVRAKWLMMPLRFSG